MCVCVCVWGGGGGGLDAVRANRYAHSTPLRVTFFFFFFFCALAKEFKFQLTNSIFFFFNNRCKVAWPKTLVVPVISMAGFKSHRCQIFSILFNKTRQFRNTVFHSIEYAKWQNKITSVFQRQNAACRKLFISNVLFH